MLTTAFTRVAAATAAVVVLAATVSSAGAQAPSETPAAPSSVQTTGALPDKPSTTPAPTSPTPPDTTQAAPPSASDTNAADSVANAATPAAPPSTAPAATAPAAPSGAAPATPAPDAAAGTAPVTDPAAATQPAAAPTPPPPPADPIVAAVRTWLGTAANTSKAHKDDAAAAVAFYGARSEKPLWVDSAGFTANAKSAMDEVRKADDWGLSAAAFDLPDLAGTPSTEALAEAEGKLSLTLLKYVRFARGGRINPASLSRILDVTPPIKDPNTVLAELAAASAADAYLRDQHPKHAQFQLLHKALLKARGPAEPAVDIDPALKVSLPATREMLKVGIEHPNVALLRQRMKVPAEASAKDTLFDEKLELAIKAYQVEKGLKATGELTGATRKALNAEVDVHRAPDPDRASQLLVLNMERWRWMPENLGRVYVWNNIPEYTTRTIKGDEVLFKERIIVGLPQWATPVFSETMKTIAFNPSWGMPDGIKTRELAPRLRAAGGGFFFFGGGGGGNIIRAYGLDVYRGGRKIDPDSVDWTSADLRNYSFIQPPGGKNPLGQVKFLFPNRHDVYMHDTIERSLFAQPNRALSHGCIRVQDPMRFARIMLAEGNGLDARGVEQAIAGGGEIKLKDPIPVHITYFTAVADASGHVSTFGDLYGHDSRLSAALTGRTIRFDPGVASDDVVAVADDAPAGDTRQGKKKKKYKTPDTLADAISGFWMN
jgi:murein L,D-transpeptidase YcbB/YkuD